MSCIENEKFLVPAPDEVHRGLGLGYRADEVLTPSYVQQRALDVREVYPLPAKFHLSLGELVLLIEFPDPLLKSLAWEGRPVVHPLAYR